MVWQAKKREHKRGAVVWIESVSIIYSGKCRKRLSSTGQCVNPNCPQGAGDTGLELETNTQFKMTLSMSDHTGTIGSCILNDEATQTLAQSGVSARPVLHGEHHGKCALIKTGIMFCFMSTGEIVVGGRISVPDRRSANQNEVAMSDGAMQNLLSGRFGFALNSMCLVSEKRPRRVVLSISCGAVASDRSFDERVAGSSARALLHRR